MSSFDVVRSGRRVRRTVLLAAVAGLAGVAPAQAAVPIAGGTDDAAGDGGAADLRRVDVRFDGAGQMQLVAQLAGAPTSGNLLAVAGRSGGGTSCTAAVGAGTSLADSSPGSWYVFSASGEAQPQGQVARQVDGTVVTLTAQDPRLADTQVDCALVRIVDARGTVLDETERFSLAAQTPPPPTTTTPAPPAPPPATTPAPASPPAPATPTLAPAAPTRSGAHLELKLPQVADRGKRGITRTLRLLVTNRGTATASRPVVQLTAPKGVTVSPRRVQLASIKRAKSRSLTIRVKVSRAAKAASTVGVSVKTTSKGTAHSASGRLPLPIKRTASASPTSGGGQPASDLVGKAFYTALPDGAGGATTDGVYFQDDRWAIRGALDGAIPTCTTRTADADGEGCVPYTYDKATRSLVVDGKPGSYDPAQQNVLLDDTTLGYFPLVPAGTALVTDAERVSCVGFAPYATCSTSQFIARADGTFQTQGSAASSSSSGDVTAIGADRRGTYTVDAPGRLHLRYADGHEVVRAVQLFRDGDTGETDPATRGLIIDGGLYTP